MAERRYRQVDDAVGFSRSAGPYSACLDPDETAPDRAVWRGLRVTEDHLNEAALLHGGALLAFADELLGAVLDEVLPGRWAVTVDLGVAFQGSCRLGDFVEARGELTRSTGRLAFLEGRFFVGGRIIGSTRGVFRHGARRPAESGLHAAANAI